MLKAHTYTMTFHGEPPKYTAMYLDANVAPETLTNRDILDVACRAVLLEFKKNGSRRFEVVEKPHEVLGVVTTHTQLDKWFGPSGIVVQNCLGGDVRIRYNGLFLKCSEFTTEIPFIKMITIPTVNLPDLPIHSIMNVKPGTVVRFITTRGCDMRRHAINSAERAAENFLRSNGLYPAPSAPPAPVAAIPKHIARLVIMDAVAKNEDCPVSMEPLTAETATITPCGHVVSRHAAEHWMLSAHSCPVCRAPCSVEQLQRL
jgi:hypothetical protein